MRRDDDPVWTRRTKARRPDRALWDNHIFQTVTLAFILLAALLLTARAQTTAPVTAQVSCGTTATQLLGFGTSYVSRQVSNQSGATVWIGPSGVTPSTGFAVPSGSGYNASQLLAPAYCVASGAPATVSTLQY